MDSDTSLPGSPTPTPLQPVSDERVNQMRDSSASAFFSSVRGHSRDSSVVHDKINQFNSLSVQSKALERKTADAALKRAMLGREEAETEMRRFRDEVRGLRKQVEEGKERERRVGERLETVMVRCAPPPATASGRSQGTDRAISQENYGRAKETHAHTQALWEKEIRRARKETFKSQSVIVKLQEELKSAKGCLRTVEENLEREKERSRAREQEAFQARYELVGCQGQLEQALERVRVLEQERDAFKSLAKSDEDVARIAAEGLLPLPKAEDPDETDEFASPRKARVSSVGIADIRSSATSEAEIDELTRLWHWEKQRADRASEQVDFLEAECHLRACCCMKKRPRASTVGSARKRPDTRDGAEIMILGGEKPVTSPVMTVKANLSPKKLNLTKPRAEPRRSTIFVPEEGVFRTVSQEEAEAMDVAAVPVDDLGAEPPTPNEENNAPRFFSRTPSVDPPAFAVTTQTRTSLLSLLDAPHEQEPPLRFNIPTASAPRPVSVAEVERAEVVEVREVVMEEAIRVEAGQVFTVEDQLQPTEEAEAEDLTPRPHTSAAFYSTKTTTTKVPLRKETTEPGLARRLLDAQRQEKQAKASAPRTGGRDAAPSFDVTNPALTPTMTREQALAQIRERRGRARSAAAGAMTPRKQMMQGVERRDVSAPVPRTAPMGSVRKNRTR